jgi:hypothetical protein
MQTGLSIIKKFLDDRYPDGGTDGPMFAVMVVLFSAAFLRITSVDALCLFTDYRRDFVNAIAVNMINNGLWEGGHYKASGWLRDGDFNDDEFWDQVEIACGMRWLSDDAVHSGKTTDPLCLMP